LEIDTVKTRFSYDYGRELFVRAERSLNAPELDAWILFPTVAIAVWLSSMPR
jgi:hypothetical protein